MVQHAVVIGDSGLVEIYQYTQLENILILQKLTECLLCANSVLDTMDTSMKSHGFVLSWGRQTANRYRASLVAIREIHRDGAKKEATQQTPTYKRDPHVPLGIYSTGHPPMGRENSRRSIHRSPRLL